MRAFYLNSICTLDLYISQIRVQILFKNSRSSALKLQLGCKLCGCQDRSVCFGSFLFPRRGLSRKAPSNARGDDPFLGGFFFIFFRHARRGRSRNLASHRPSQAFWFLRGPAFLLCGNLLSLDRGNDCARPFIFPSWCVPSGSRSDRAGPGLGRGSGDV